MKVHEFNAHVLFEALEFSMVLYKSIIAVLVICLDNELAHCIYIHLSTQ